jgi:ATP-dependent Clp endopeptidase proteolytic subunit ClpP
MSKEINRQLDDAELRKIEAELRLTEIRTKAADLELRQAEREERDWEAAAYQHRIYNFFGAVDKKSAADCLETMAYWSRLDPRCSITLTFNSPGGSVIDGLALFDELLVLRDNGHHITTVARGMAASMGAVLLQAGDERIIGKNAHMLIHQISYGAMGSFGEIEDEVAFAKQLQNRLLEILAERSTFSKTQIKNRWERRDWWLGSEEVLKGGFADRVG